jgi:hypothetical protein
MVDPLTNEQMSPDASPGTLSRRSGVRRVNNLPMYLIGGVMTVFLGIMVLVAADRAAQQNKPNAGPKEKGGNTSLFASEIAGDTEGWNHSTGSREAAASPRTLPARDHRRRCADCTPGQPRYPAKAADLGRRWHAPERLP